MIDNELFNKVKMFHFPTIRTSRGMYAHVLTYHVKHTRNVTEKQDRNAHLSSDVGKKKRSDARKLIRCLAWSLLMPQLPQCYCRAAA